MCYLTAATIPFGKLPGATEVHRQSHPRVHRLPLLLCWAKAAGLGCLERGAIELQVARTLPNAAVRDRAIWLDKQLFARHHHAHEAVRPFAVPHRGTSPHYRRG